MLRRLAVFAGIFGINAALTIASSETVDRSLVLRAIESLVAKSMIASRTTGATMRYQLLDTARAYARESSVDNGEFAEVAARHAIYCRQSLEQNGVEWPALAIAMERDRHFIAIHNVRAALEWCFGASCIVEIGI